MSTLPSMFKQDDVAFQVPTTMPPQGVTLEHEAVAEPPVPVPTPAVVPVELPAVALVPPVPVLDVPAVPAGGSEDTLHAPEIKPSAVTVAMPRTAVSIFIGGSLFGGSVRRCETEIGDSARADRLQ
jgi:hypothetical protein